jgi:MarR family transcriptional regulator, organic hydroperoxide resistance regulator
MSDDPSDPSDPGNPSFSHANDDQRRGALESRLYVLGEVASTETALFQQAAAASYGLGITDMKALSSLLREGPMTAGQLARRLGLTTGAVTNVVDRLERRDVVTRAADVHDRRKVIVSVNQSRLAAGENVYQSIGAAFHQLHETYTLAELEFLVRYHEASIELTRREIVKLTRHKARPSEGVNGE